MRYFQNNDSSTFKFSSFNESPKDLYPTLTICFADTFSSGGLYDAEYLEEKFGISTHLYQDILSGTNATGQMGIDSEVKGSVIANAFNIDLKNIVPGFRNIIYMVLFKELNQTKSVLVEYDKGSKEMPFYISYQDPVNLCYSRKTMLWNFEMPHTTPHTMQLCEGDLYI